MVTPNPAPTQTATLPQPAETWRFRSERVGLFHGGEHVPVRTTLFTFSPIARTCRAHPEGHPEHCQSDDVQSPLDSSLHHRCSTHQENAQSAHSIRMTERVMATTSTIRPAEVVGKRSRGQMNISAMAVAKGRH